MGLGFFFFFFTRHRTGASRLSILFCTPLRLAVLFRERQRQRRVDVQQQKRPTDVSPTLCAQQLLYEDHRNEREL